MSQKLILAIDQGTTSSRAVLYDPSLKKIDQAQKEFPQYFENAGWVEQDAEEIWESQWWTVKTILRRNKLSAPDISVIGITNQRETVVAWDTVTGKPLTKAIVWQDRRTSAYCSELKQKNLESTVSEKTGLLLDPYFSGTKMHWLLQNNKKVQQAAQKNRLAFGTIDTWLIYKLTGGNKYVTDTSNASRTLLFNIHTLKWDAELLSLFKIPAHTLPQVLDSNAHFGDVALPELKGVPIHGVAGDQQASLFGNRCFKKGELKNTYGTGCFLLKNIGPKYFPPPKGILGTVAWTLDGKTTYAHEGAVMIGGAVIQFLRDGLKILNSANESEAIALKLNSTGAKDVSEVNQKIFFVPAFAGLGTPYWDPHARGLIIGLTRGTTRAHLIRAALESIAFQSVDLCDALTGKGGHFGGKIPRLQVDGGASQNQFLMQFQADVLKSEVHVNLNPEMTALGVAMLASLGAGLTPSIHHLAKLQLEKKIFKPKMKDKIRQQLLLKWHDALNRSKAWAT